MYIDEKSMRILKQNKTIAAVGCSRDSQKAAHSAHFDLECILN
jgi:predicted CoA-binding protein